MNLEEENKKLREENRKLREELESIKKKFDNTKKEFEEFKAMHAKTVANLQKALKIKPDKKKQAKPLGAPKAHKGYARHIPERIDYVKQLTLKRCPYCGTRLTGKTQEIRSRYVTEIKLTSKVKNTRYDIHRKYCPKCKKLVEREVPNVLPHARFGLNLMLLVMYLKLGLRLPCNKVCDYFLTLYDLKISEGEIVVILRQLTVAFGKYYSYLEKLVKLARVKYTDTTSWRVNSKNYFAWVFIAYGIVLYKIRKRNNHKVALALFGKKQSDKILVVDRHSAFRTLAEKVGFKLQLCWSHILQDAKELARDFGAEGKYVKKKLKEIYELANGLEHKGTTEMVEQLKGEIFLLTQRHYKSLTVWRFVKNLYYRDAENLFRFVTDPEIDATNNISERELRALVIIRKISNCSRSIMGANTTAMLLSVVQTLRFNKQNVLKGLQDILNNPSGY
ncbi:MAG TPA: IS66 family transposase [Candidatus Woesearchaeota archaeon]|nr:IS66 family transposase [Candidatus Woesearchaeota archaeon]